MAVDLVVLFDDGLMTAVVKHSMADVVHRRGDGHVVAAMDSRGRGDESLKQCCNLYLQ
jgi:hypothetical protein